MRRQTLTGLAACLGIVALVLSLAAPASAQAKGEPFNGEPKILSLEGFVFPVHQGADLRVGALMVSRYPRVLDDAFPAQIRKLLSFRAKGKVKVFRHGARIAKSHDSGGLPVAIKGRSLYYAHLLLFSVKQSGRILGSSGARAAGDGAADAVKSEAAAIQLVKHEGETLARTSAETSQKVALSNESPPRVIDGCVIEPSQHFVDSRQCWFANLTDADLSSANLRYINFYSARLTRANLTDADLSGASFEFARLIDANLSYVHSFGANFHSADLTRANLTDADFPGSLFTDANLTDANLTDAHFFPGDPSMFTGANLTGTIFCRTRMPDGSFNNSGCPGP